MKLPFKIAALGLMLGLCFAAEARAQDSIVKQAEDLCASGADKGDMDGALADLNHAIELYPDGTAFYTSRGNVRHARGDLQGAMADFDHAVGLEPKNPVPYLFRGVEKFRLGRWADALADLRHCCELPAEGQGLDYRDYAHMYIWLTRARLGETDAASKELSAYLAQRTYGDPGDWFSKQAGYLAGTVTEAGLLAAASVPDKKPDPDQHCEAWFYSGMKKLAGGDKKGAAYDFHQCAATKRLGAVEYQMAQAELKALGE